VSSVKIVYEVLIQPVVWIQHKTAGSGKIPTTLPGIPKLAGSGPEKQEKLHKIPFEPTNMGREMELKGTGGGSLDPLVVPPRPLSIAESLDKIASFFAQNVNKQTYTRINLAIIRTQLVPTHREPGERYEEQFNDLFVTYKEAMRFFLARKG